MLLKTKQKKTWVQIHLSRRRLLGPTGRGTEEFLKVVKNRVHIINSTLGKTLDGAAGYYPYKTTYF